MAQEDRITGLVGYSGAKVPVRVATTASITLNGLQTIDGTALAQDDRVLVKNQTDTTENGIWVADTGDWNRAPDCDGPYDLAKGSLIFVTDGATNGTNWFYCTTTDPVPDGSMAIAFAKSSTALAVISAFWQGVVSLATAALSRAALGLYDPLATGSVITAKGDLIVGTAANTAAAHAVGTDFFDLCADSSKSDGVDYKKRPGSVASGRNLAGRTNSSTPNSKVDFTADELVVRDGSGGSQLLQSVSVTSDITASGANGLDTGAEASNTWYYHWVIAKADGTVAGLISTSATAPTMPTGYTMKALVGAVRNDGSSNFLKFRQNGNKVSFEEQQAILSSGTATVETSVSTASFVPPIAECVTLYERVQVTSSGTPATASNRVRFVSGSDFFQVQAQTDASTAYGNASMDVPNVSQNIYYIMTTGGGVSTKFADIFVQGFKLPMGGE